MNRYFRAFTDLKSLELEVPMICLVTGCVSLRRDRRYSFCMIYRFNTEGVFIKLDNFLICLKKSLSLFLSHISFSLDDYLA